MKKFLLIVLLTACVALIAIACSSNEQTAAIDADAYLRVHIRADSTDAEAQAVSTRCATPSSNFSRPSLPIVRRRSRP